ncbi:hypothetical protein EW146_g8082 [Bondarzewia mesenterica]|uniref:PEBP-like protein n=1 Tax=Bondarzewia mesenterica TaxID=1095465 RepID=A0A4S4LHT9_9AGAM|nr:hypothetical protein EW146_g8082 [Bondarzewia mesenterica]
MLTVRRLLAVHRPLVRANATLPSNASKPAPPPLAAPSSSDSATTTATGAAANVKTRGRKIKYTRQRPSITLERPRGWCRPLPLGVLPAYDEALRYLAQDSRNVQREARVLKEKLESGKIEGEEAEKERERLNVLEVMSEVNLPEVRWKAANGMADLSKPVYRHLVEKRWREEGALDLLMERIHQMNVVPDVIPELRPGLDLRITFPEPPPRSVYLRTRVKRRHIPIEPGVFLLNEQTRKPPSLYTTVFHTDERLYTMLMVDADVPDVETESFTTYLHWLQPNITLSTNTSLPLPLTATHTPYIPPHPARGSPYHRYILLLLPQSSPTERIRVSQIERRGFDLRTFVQEHGLKLEGGGAHMWRAVWDEESGRIWEEVLKLPQPRYGYLPKPDPYAEVKSKGKYLS